MKNKMNKPLIIKSGINWLMIFGTLAAIGLVAVFVTSDSWMDDGRPVMARNNDSVINFNKSTVKIGQNFYLDHQLNIGEIVIEESKYMNLNSELQIQIFTENEVEYSSDMYMVSKGTCIQDPENELKCNQKTLIQFGLPKDFYYLSVVLTQQDNKSEVIQLDYRNFIEKQLNEKQPNYMQLRDENNIKIVGLESQRAPYDKTLSGLQTTLKSKDSEIKTLETSINAISDEKAKAEKQALLDIKKTEKMDIENKISENQKVINEINAQIEKLKKEMGV